MNEEVKEIREMLDIFSQPMLFERRKHIYNNEFINFEKTGELLREGLIKSYGADYVVANLKKVFDITNDYNEYEKNFSKGYIATDSSTLRFGRKDKEKTIIELIIPNNKWQIGRIEKFLNVCGWYIATNETDQYCKNGYVHLVFEKKISKHPERIYFLTGKISENDLSIFSKQFFIHTNSNKYIEYNKMVLLTIDISGIRKTTKFYSDPNADGCVYCYDNIPPECVVDVEDIY